MTVSGGGGGVGADRVIAGRDELLDCVFRASLVAAVLADLSERRLKRVHLVGHSMGGAVAMLLAPVQA